MKKSEQVEYLLRKGKKAKELEELGFSKHIITRVRRQLREEREQQKQTTRKVKIGTKDQPPSPAPSLQQVPGIIEILSAIDAKYMEVLERLSAIEGEQAKLVTFNDLDERLAGTPALGLRHHYQCECSESGYVALQIQCTKCGRKSWWGWFPK